MAVHHRRRLRKLGHAARIDPPDDGLWAAGDPPPRAGNALEILVDGAQALPAIARAIRGARRHVHIAGWSITPHFALTRDEPPRPPARTARRHGRARAVRVLMWAGAPAPTFAPDRATARDARDELMRGTQSARLRRALARAALPPREARDRRRRGRVRRRDRHDLLGGDRWDTNAHPARGRLGWHDAASRLRGPAVADVAAHFAGAGRGHRRAGRRARRRPRSPRATPRSRSSARCPSASTTSSATATSGSSRPTSAPSAPPAARVPREPVPLGARDRRRARGQAPRAADRRLPGRRRAALAREQRAGGHPRPARACSPTPTPGRPLPRRHDLVAHRADGRPPLRPRQDRHRRRPLADVGSANLNAHSLSTTAR